MAELSIEEKARRYDGAIKRLEDIETGKCQKTFMFTEGLFDYIFPELKESEDEKIRKELLVLVKQRPAGFPNYKKYIAWLEKQGEQKPAEWDILSAKKGDMLSNGTIVLIVDSIGEFEGRPIINSWYFADSEKFYGKGTSECDRWEVDGFRTATEAECNYLLKMMADTGYVWDTNKLELMEIEQKPAWSEEDEKLVKNLISTLSNLYARNLIEKETKEKYTNLLKSLKDRVQPQQRQEWSEEEKSRIDRIIDVLDWAEDRGRISYSDWEEYVCYVKTLRPQPEQNWYKVDNKIQEQIINYFRCQSMEEPSRKEIHNKWVSWLKSLRPQNRWKPSDEQMKLLREVQQALLGKDCHNRFVDFMYELKRLREE